MRRFWNDGQEITFEDLAGAAPAMEQQIYDVLGNEMVNRTSDAFFQDSFKTIFVGATQVLVKKGLGIQNDSAQVSPEPKKRPVYIAADAVVNLASPDASLDRIDIICVKNRLVNELTVSRKYKDPLPSTTVTTTSQVVQKKWDAEFLQVQGTPNVSPSAPATPSGYIKICELYMTAVSGLSGQVDITDTRALLPVHGLTAIDTSDFVSVPTIGSATPLQTVLAELDELAKATARLGSVYNAFVGSQPWCTHATIAAALAAISAGESVYVTESQTINTQIDWNKANTRLHLAPGVVLSKGTATVGINVQVVGVEIAGGKMTSFSGGGGKAIQFQAAVANGKVWGMRFSGNTTDVDDSAVAVTQFGNSNE